MPARRSRAIRRPSSPKQACAVDTNKLYDLITFDRQPEPTRLAVDVVNSRFALAYVDKSEDVHRRGVRRRARRRARQSEPKVSLALDPCSSIDHAAIEYDGKHWLLGTIDARERRARPLGARVRPGSKAKYTAYNVTESDAAEREFALLALGDVTACWRHGSKTTPQPPVSTRLKTRKLSARGRARCRSDRTRAAQGHAWTFSSTLARCSSARRTSAWRIGARQCRPRRTRARRACRARASATATPGC